MFSSKLGQWCLLQVPWYNLITMHFKWGLGCLLQVPWCNLNIIAPKEASKHKNPRQWLNSSWDSHDPLLGRSNSGKVVSGRAKPAFKQDYSVRIKVLVQRLRVDNFKPRKVVGSWQWRVSNWAIGVLCRCRYPNWATLNLKGLLGVVCLTETFVPPELLWT